MISTRILVFHTCEKKKLSRAERIATRRVQRNESIEKVDRKEGARKRNERREKSRKKKEKPRRKREEGQFLVIHSRSEKNLLKYHAIAIERQKILDECARGSGSNSDGASRVVYATTTSG